MAEREAPPRAWQRMLSGRRLDLIDPSPLDIEIEDIAHGLARVARWNGQTKGAHVFSVAQHSLLVTDIAARIAGPLAPDVARAVLLHDAAEYVIGDLISPFKAVIGGAYKAMEHRLKAAIHLRFALPAETPAATEMLIKRADQAAAFLEATQLAGFETREAQRFFGDLKGIYGPGRGAAPTLDPWPTEAAEAAFLARFRDVGGT